MYIHFVSAHLNAQKILQSRWMSTAQNSACAYSFKTFYVPNFSKHREQSQKDKSEIEDIEPLVSFSILKLCVQYSVYTFYQLK